MLKKMTKEELELLSYTKIAELYLKEKKTTLSTAELFKEACNSVGLKSFTVKNINNNSIIYEYKMKN